jgi:hypothetical protein
MVVELGDEGNGRIAELPAGTLRPGLSLLLKSMWTNHQGA